MNHKGQTNFNIETGFFIFIIIFVIFGVGDILGWWGWVKPFFIGVGIVLKWLFIITIIILIIYFIIWLTKYIKKQKEVKIKKEEERKFIEEQTAKGLVLYKNRWLTKTQFKEEEMKVEERAKKEQEELKKEKERVKKEQELELRREQKRKEKEEEAIKVELKVKYREELKSLTIKEQKIFLNRELNKIFEEKEKLKEEEKRVREKRANIDSQIREIMDYLDDYPLPIVRDEKELEHNIYSYLIGKASEMEIKFQQKLETGGRIDILIDNVLGVELKIAESKNHLRDLIGQVEEYVSVFDKLLIVILDVGVLSEDMIQFYVNKYEEKGAKVIVIKGQRRKNRR